MAPLVSVIIPFRNDAATLEAAIASVVAQTYRPIEIVLCDDGATDGSRAVAQRLLSARHEITHVILDGPQRGAAAARNSAIRASQGELIAFLDSDDVWFPKKLERVVGVMRSGVTMVGHAEEWRDELGASRVVRYRSLIDETVPLALSVFRLNPFSTSALTVRKDAITAVGLFDERLPSAEDYDLWLKLSLLPDAHAIVLDEVLGVYSLRAGSESSRVDARHAAMLEIGVRYLAQVRTLRGAMGMEGVRYRSRVRLASGVRYMRAGHLVRGALLAAASLLAWPYHPELRRLRRARSASSAESAT